MQINSRNKLAIFLIVFFIFVFSALVSATTLVEPGRFIFSLEPGSQISDAIAVTNTGNEEIEISATLYDWILDDEDQLVTFKKNTRPDTLYGLIKFNPRQFKLAPGETQLVRFTIKTPKEGFNLEKRGIVFFEQKNLFNQDGVGATVVTKVGCTIYATPTTATSSFRLVKAIVHMPTDSEPLGVLLIKNGGDAHIRYYINYKVVDASGGLLEEGNVNEKVILPNSDQIVSFPIIAGLSNGKYNLLLEFSFSRTDKKFVHAIPFEVGHQE